MADAAKSGEGGGEGGWTAVSVDLRIRNARELVTSFGFQREIFRK